MEITTVVEDIYKVLSNGIEISDETAKAFGDRMATLVQQKLSPKRERQFTLSMSNIGKSARQLWYESKGTAKEPLRPEAYMKFLYGDIIEELVLFLAELSGHSVTDRQAEVSVNGIKGHIDCKIDGKVTDVKSTSSQAYKKFKDSTLSENDPFGYIAQISGYATALEQETGFFLANDKTLGHICLLPVSKQEMWDIPKRIDYLRDVLSKDTPPEVTDCAELNTEANGNVILGTKCSYCPFKNQCFPEMRTFLYATGPKYLAKVVSEPRVREILPNEKNEEQE